MKWRILSLVAVVVRPGRLYLLVAFASIHLCAFVHTQYLESSCDDAGLFVIFCIHCWHMRVCTGGILSPNLWQIRPYIYICLCICICGRRQWACVFYHCESQFVTNTSVYVTDTPKPPSCSTIDLGCAILNIQLQIILIYWKATYLPFNYLVRSIVQAPWQCTPSCSAASRHNRGEITWALILVKFQNYSFLKSHDWK